MVEIKKYIDENGHLPDIPSGQDVFTNGYNMVEMDGLLLKKIEELLEIEISDYVEYLDLLNCILVKRLMFL